MTLMAGLLWQLRGSLSDLASTVLATLVALAQISVFLLPALAVALLTLGCLPYWLKV